MTGDEDWGDANHVNGEGEGAGDGGGGRGDLDVDETGAARRMRLRNMKRFSGPIGNWEEDLLRYAKSRSSDNGFPGHSKAKDGSRGSFRDPQWKTTESPGNDPYLTLGIDLADQECRERQHGERWTPRRPQSAPPGQPVTGNCRGASPRTPRARGLQRSGTAGAKRSGSESRRSDRTSRWVMDSDDATFHRKPFHVLSATPRRRQSVATKWTPDGKMAVRMLESPDGQPEGRQPRPPASAEHQQGRPRTQVHALGGGPLSGRQSPLYRKQRAATERTDSLNQYLCSTTRGYVSNDQHLARPVRVDSWGNIVGRAGTATMTSRAMALRLVSAA